MQLPSSVCTISRWRFLIIYVFIFGCTGSLLLHRRLSSCGEQGLLSSGPRASHRRGFSCCRAQTLGHKGSVLVAHGLMTDLAQHSMRGCCQFHAENPWQNPDSNAGSLTWGLECLTGMLSCLPSSALGSLSPGAPSYVSLASYSDYQCWLSKKIDMWGRTFSRAFIQRQ